MHIRMTHTIRVKDLPLDCWNCMSATLPYDSSHTSPLHRIAISTTSSAASGIRLDHESLQQENYIQEYILRPPRMLRCT